MDRVVVVKIKTSSKLKAQQNYLPPPIDVKGRVLNENGEPVTGASVIVKGTNYGTNTNEYGYFELKNVNENAVLIISAVNIQTREIKIDGKSDLAVINVRSKVTDLDDVQIMSTGYQQIPKERATGSFAKVDQGMINRSVSNNILDRLEGMASGIHFNRQPLAREAISIRGRSTIFANADVLLVVDGFPYDGDISNINPNDVESITILKDAAAASIWGARASNGVIVIATKKGKTNMPATLSFGSNLTVGQKPDLLAESRISSADFIKNETWLFDNGYYNSTINSVFKPKLSPAVEILLQKRNGLLTDQQASAMLDELGQHDVRKDMLNYLYQEKIEQQYYLNITGGSKNFTYYVSGGFDKTLANEIGNDKQRITLNAINTYRPLKKLELSTGINFIRTTSNSNSPVNYYNLNPCALVKNPAIKNESVKINFIQWICEFLRI